MKSIKKNGNIITDLLSPKQSIRICGAERFNKLCSHEDERFNKLNMIEQQAVALDHATPQEVAVHKAQRIGELRNNIRDYEERIETAKAEIAEWESL